jgi:hypothetical protein
MAVFVAVTVVFALILSRLFESVGLGDLTG